MYAITFKKGEETVCLAPDEIAEENIISFEQNSKTKMEILIYPEFEAWDFVKKDITYVTLLDLSAHNVETFGRVTDITDSMDNSGKNCRRVVCAGEMDFLEDVVMDSKSYDTTVTTVSFVDYLLQIYNARVDSTRQFTRGNIYYSVFPYKIRLDYMTILDTLKKVFVDILKWEIRTRHENGVNYFDARPSFGSQSTTAIRIGDNLKEIKAVYGANNKLITRLIPVGGRGYDGERLTIGRVHTTPYVDNNELVNKYGIYEALFVVDNLSAQSYEVLDEAESLLLDAAEEEAAALTDDPPVQITLFALDLQKLGYSGYAGFKVSDSYLTICPKLGIYTYLKMTGVKRKLAYAQNVEITIATETNSRIYNIQSPSVSYQIAQYEQKHNDLFDNLDKKQTEMTNEKLDTRLQDLSFKKLTEEEYEELVDEGELDDDTIYTVVGEDPVTGVPTAALYLGGTHISEGGGGDDGIPYPAEMIYVLDTACFGFAASCSLQSVSAGAAWVEGSWDRRRVEVSGETKEIVVPVSNDRAQRTTIYPDSDYLYFDIESDEYLSYTGYCVDSGGYYVGMVLGYTKLRTTPQIKSSARWIAISGLPAGTVAVHLQAGKDYGAAVRGDTVYYLG